MSIPDSAKYGSAIEKQFRCIEMLEDFGDDDAIKLARHEIAYEPMMKLDSRRQPSATFDRRLVWINGGHLYPASARGTASWDPLPHPTSSTLSSRPFPSGKLSLYGAVHETEAAFRIPTDFPGGMGLAHPF